MRTDAMMTGHCREKVAGLFSAAFPARTALPVGPLFGAAPTPFFPGTQAASAILAAIQAATALSAHATRFLERRTGFGKRPLPTAS